MSSWRQASLNRRWIACDLGRFAIHTTRKRLLGIPGVRPFIVHKYERQLWLDSSPLAPRGDGADATSRNEAATIQRGRGSNVGVFG